MLRANPFKRRHWAPLALGGALLAGLASPAVAGASSDITVSVHVDAFCKINQPANPTLSLVNGGADIGSIFQICNTAAGSQVTARFTNLSGGTLSVSGQLVTIGSDGTATLTASAPHVQTADWQLVNATPIDANAPVTVQLAIASN